MSSLLDALNDADWWVRERAIDALAGVGARRAVPPLVRVMETDAKAAPVAIRALATLGDPKSIPPLLTQLRSADRAMRAEAIRAVAALADEAHAEMVRRALTAELNSLSGELRDLANQSLRTLDTKFGSRPPGDATATEVRTSIAPAQSLLFSQEPPMQIASLIVEPGRDDPNRVPAQATLSGPPVDPASLAPGMVLVDRYRVLRNIGSGAFWRRDPGGRPRRARGDHLQVPQAPRGLRRERDQALRPGAALPATDHPRERDPHPRLHRRRGVVRHLHGVLPEPLSGLVPQGGVDRGEEPRAAAFRELEEEVGVPASLVDLLEETEDWLYYDFPVDIRSKMKPRGRFLGQRQKWFAFRFKGPDADIRLDTHTPEFSDWRWASLDSAPELVIPFKRPTYEEVARRFKKYGGGGL